MVCTSRIGSALKGISISLNRSSLELDNSLTRENAPWEGWLL